MRAMRCNAARHSVPSRKAFTLIELLVTLSIIIVLAAISVTGFRSAYDTDRVREGASVLRGAFEGARSRAIRAKAPRGIRLLPDQNDRRIVTSIVHIASSEVLEGHLRYEFDPAAGHWRIMDVSEDVDPSNRVYWRELYQSGLIREGCEIEITQSGRTETFHLLAPANGAFMGDMIWVLDTPPNSAFLGKEKDGFPGEYEPVNPDTNEPDIGIGLPGEKASRPVAYKIKMVPAVVEGVAPIILPRNICIDLDGSKLPETWCPGGGGRYGAFLDEYGPVGGRSSNPKLLPMDIMFTPRGVVSNDLITEGFIHLHLADIQDINEARLNPANGLPVTSIASRPMVVMDPKYPTKIVTLVTNSGMLRISNVTGAGSSGDPPIYNTTAQSGIDPFRNAILGREAK